MGKDLYEHLDYVYQRAARYCVLFASEHYARKVWTSHERKSAQARALHENEEYILPVRFDDTEIPGLRSTVAYVDARATTPDELIALILEKLNTPPRQTAFAPAGDIDKSDKVWRVFYADQLEGVVQQVNVVRVWL